MQFSGSSVRMSVHIPVTLSVHIPVTLSVHIPVTLSVSLVPSHCSFQAAPSECQYISLSLCQYISPSLCQFHWFLVIAVFRQLCQNVSTQACRMCCTWSAHTLKFDGVLSFTVFHLNLYLHECKCVGMLCCSVSYELIFPVLLLFSGSACFLSLHASVFFYRSFLCHMHFCRKSVIQLEEQITQRTENTHTHLCIFMLACTYTHAHSLSLLHTHTGIHAPPPPHTHTHAKKRNCWGRLAKVGWCSW